MYRFSSPITGIIKTHATLSFLSVDEALAKTFIVDPSITRLGLKGAIDVKGARGTVKFTAISLHSTGAIAALDALMQSDKYLNHIVQGDGAQQSAAGKQNLRAHQQRS